MIRLILSTIIILASAIGINARTYVLITAVSNYGDIINNVSQTTKNAKRFKEVMETQTKDIIILTSKYATSKNILEKMSALCNRAQKGDRIIFFYSGHGYPGGINAYDSELSYNSIAELLSGTSASEVICFIEACHSGSLEDYVVQDTAPKIKPGQVFFMSSRKEEASIEANMIGAGYFSQALIKGMRGKADTDANKGITVSELFKYVYADVVKRSKDSQHPRLIAPKEMFDANVTQW